MLPGQVNYGESENNGVKSYKHGGWPKSFKVSKPQTDKSFANVPKEEPGRPGEPGKYGESEEPEEPGKSKRPEKFNESGKSPESGEVEEPKKAVETGKYNDPGEYPNKPIQPLKWQEPENYDKARQSEEPEKPKEIWKPIQSGKSPDSEDRKDPSMSKVPTHNSQLVDDDCTKTGEHLPDGISELICLRECVTVKGRIRGTDTYTEDSLACKAATHSGALPITGGKAEVETIPGLPDHQGSTKHGIKSEKYGKSSRSLVFRKPSSKIPETPSKLPDSSSFQPTEPESPSKQPTETPFKLPDSSSSQNPESPSKQPTDDEIDQTPPTGTGHGIDSTPTTVDDDCTKTGEHLPDGISKLLCLRECVTAKMDIWGTDNYTEDSLACKAATHAGALPITGGMAEVEKLPGLPKYDGSTRNDITSKKYGTWSRSLVFRKPSSKISETPSKLPDFSSSKPTEPESPSKQPTDDEIDQTPPSVTAHCSWTGDVLRATVNLVKCPRGCLQETSTVYGNYFFSSNSAICLAAIFRGFLTDEKEGEFFALMKPGQDSYSEDERHGVRTQSSGPSPRSFILVSLKEFQRNRDMYMGYIPDRGERGQETDSTLSPDMTYETTAEPPKESNEEIDSTLPTGVQEDHEESSEEIDSTPPTIVVFCSSTGIHLHHRFTIIQCPAGCGSFPGVVYGSYIHPLVSSMCGAAVHGEALSNDGGKLLITKEPGQEYYEASLNKGIQSMEHGKSQASFTVTLLSSGRSGDTSADLDSSSLLDDSNIPTATATCFSTAMSLKSSKTKVTCPPGCLAANAEVYGSGIYTDDSSICVASIHFGMLTNEGGTAMVAKKPGLMHYSGSTQNDVTTEETEEWSGSFTFLSYTSTPSSKLPKAIAECSSNAVGLKDRFTLLKCPKNCLGKSGNVWGTNTYTEDSAMCLAALLEKLLSEDGEQREVVVEKKAGQKFYQGSGGNGIVSLTYEERSENPKEWHMSFALHPPSAITDKQISQPSGSENPTADAETSLQAPNLPADMTYETTAEPPKVTAHCSWTGELLRATVNLVKCPKGCLKEKSTVYGDDIFNFISPICPAAILRGFLTDEKEGEFVAIMKPGQDSYSETERHGVRTQSSGPSPRSFILVSLEEFQRNSHMYMGYIPDRGERGQETDSTLSPDPSGTAPDLPKVSATCLTTATDISDPVTMFECPENCHKQNGAVWGTDTYSALSAVCIAALHAGVSTIAGGQFFLTLMPGEVSYQKSTRNGVTTQQMGAGSKSFKLSLTYEFLKTTYTEFSYYLPETAMASGSKLDTVSADCSLTGAQLSAPLMIVICPKNCMIRKVTNLEPGIYTEDSSVCGAALDAGKIDKNGGSAMVQKNQGQRQGTFQFNSLFDFQTTTNTETSYGLHNTAGDMTMINQPVTVNAACTWTGLDLPAPITSVKCPENCKKPKVDVWGTDIYAIESLLCASAMHGGYANNNGGQFIAYLKPGQDSYEGTTRHGVTSSRQGQSSKSFVLSSSYDISSAIFTESSYGGPEKEMTWDSWYAIVPGTCSLTGKDLTASVNMIYCPKGCMKENGEVFGFKLYSYNSHICLSAVHANQVNEDGGNVIVKMLPGSLSYTGVLSNGIISKSHGKSPASFEFTASFDFQSTIQTESSYNVPQIETKVEPMAPSAWAPQVKQQSGYSKFFNRWG